MFRLASSLTHLVTPVSMITMCSNNGRTISYVGFASADASIGISISARHGSRSSSTRIGKLNDIATLQVTVSEGMSNHQCWPELIAQACCSCHWKFEQAVSLSYNTVMVTSPL